MERTAPMSATDDTADEIIRQTKKAERERYHREQQELLVDQLLGAVRPAEEYTTEFEFPIHPPLKLDHPYTGRVQISRVKVGETVRIQLTGNPEEDEPYRYASGWCHVLTAKNVPQQNKQPGWAMLPDDLAAPLLERGRTQINRPGTH